MDNRLENSRLSDGDLFQSCDLSKIDFKTTDDLQPIKEMLGQDRAAEAMRFGFEIPQKGYNLFAMGPTGAGKFSAVREFLERKAAKEEVPPDWAYVNNFEESHRPLWLQFPPGRAHQFQREMERCVEELRGAIPAAFDSEEYRSRRQEIEEELGRKQEEAITSIRERARQEGIALLRTPGGLAFAPIKDDEVLAPQEFNELPEEERKRIEDTINTFQEELGKSLHQRPRWLREAQAKIRELSRDIIQATVNSMIDDLKNNYRDLPEVVKYLEAVEADLIDNADHFHQAKDGEPMMMMGLPIQQQQQDRGEAIFRRYKVNVLVDHSEAKGAPVVYEDNPTFQNLVGRIEHVAQMGALFTDFSLIKAGAIHRANGGYLILDVLKVLSQPYAWDGLKRCLRAGEIRTETLGQMLSLITTVSLEPDPIPLKIKVVLIGERLLYYLLYKYDSDFADFFKVAVDFEEEIDRTQEASGLYARWIAGLVQEEKLRPFDRSAVGRVIEQASRISGDAEKMSVELRAVYDLLREANYWAQKESRDVVTAADVQQAIDAHIYRSDRARGRLREEIDRGRLLIETDGEQVGQINGLSVLQLGDFMFGNPSRITARVRMGAPKVIDIEREVELGGAIHSKGVLILSGFISGRYLPNQPLSMLASLVFEQNYGGVDGDSASSAELYALLSALADVPIRQSIAVTGSVNQHGQVQAIGGVNEKIEGFFDVCRKQGLTGKQGVMIPRSNVSQLMLRKDVREAAAEGKFHVYAVAHIDEGIEILTGIAAGERGDDGSYPVDSINGKVEARLKEFAERARAFQKGQQEKDS